jgi:hypothetical protein
VIFFPAIVTLVDMRGLSCAAETVTNKKAIARMLRSRIAKPVYARMKTMAGQAVSPAV